MLGVIPFVMHPCQEQDIPLLWWTLQRYGATKGYESARDGVLRAFRLSLPSAKDTPKSQTGVRLNGRDVDTASLKTLDGLLSLSPGECENAVALMLTANGYINVDSQLIVHDSDFSCRVPDGRRTYVWYRQFRPGHLLNDFEVIAAMGGNVGWSGSTRVILVTTSWYTRMALALAKEPGVTLIDGEQLVSMMQRV
jgi:hypothetical protein